MKTLKYGNLFALSALLLTACNDANYKPTTVDENFGMAYKQVTQAQILNPDAALNPPLNPPKRLDGMTGEAALGAYREGFASVERTDSVEISIGGSDSGGSSGGN